MNGPNGRPNLDARACPSRECERICGPGDLCKCAPCLCPLCCARRQQARARANARGMAAIAQAGAAELGLTSVLTLFD